MHATITYHANIPPFKYITYKIFSKNKLTNNFCFMYGFIDKYHSGMLRIKY